MLAVMTVVGIIAILFAVPSPEKETAPAIEHPAPFHAEIEIIKMEIRIAEAKKEVEPIRLPEARLLNPSTAIERYRLHERKPS